MKLKILKENNKDYNLSILDFLRILDPSKTGKFLRILLNELKFYDKSIAVVQGNVWQLSNQVEVLKGINEDMVNQLIDCLGGVDVINDMEKFEVLCDENLIEVRDVQEYKSLGEISLAVIDAEEKRKDKNSSPQKEIVFGHPDYLILKPLNEFASKKYGASTKWCTSSRDPKTFYQYSKKGVLIYILPKNDNSKWAVYYDMLVKELSWWDTKDILTDGYLVDLPEKLKKDILGYILNETNPNSYYFTEKTLLSSKEVLSVDVTEEYLDVDGDNIDLLCEPSVPSTLNVVWPPGINPDGVRYESTTNSSEKIDSLVRKTLEYHYTITALNEGGEETD
tara:strand:+ start:611 stop:1618 length:1008 start_codon:yes stop_codon:yes gene_type:complete